MLDFDASFFRRLEKLSLVAKRLTGGEDKGIRVSQAHGASVEFADFREYLPGDDLRFIDWNAYARLERLFIKLFHEEASLGLHLLLDNSRSMDFGEPGKLQYGLQLSAALAYIALSHLDRVTVTALGDRQEQSLSPRRGKQHIFSILQFLRQINPASALSLNSALRRYGAHSPRNALAVVISDFLDPEGYTDGIDYLLYRKYQVALIHLITPDEMQPRFAGDRLLQDVESGEELDVTASPRLFQRYQAVLAAHLAGIEAFARRRGLIYSRVVTSVPFEEVVLNYLRQRRMVR